MKYFNSCQSIEDVKHLYKQLAKQHHPDMGGRTETMQEINSEYSYIIAKLLKGSNLTVEEMESSILSSQNYRNAIDAIIGFVNITIELVGTWIWVTGNTYPYKDYLKENGFCYSHLKKAWYYRSEEFKAKFSSKMELSALKRIYGSTTIVNSPLNDRLSMSW
ncbi:MAG: J domain-containing protein [Saprospiraceae bacterium]|nr:J domain-containing protein [Candidatus Defluviibacterium haderslevense]MBK7244388.1 J domain-containing protein [Candidatus Defluviibacterium haderslevense]